MHEVFIGTESPDPVRTDWNKPCPRYRFPNLASRFQASALYYPSHRGALSIKCAFGGQEVYEVQGHTAAVDDGSYLILNDGQYYSSFIEATRPVESFCIFFEPNFARTVLDSLVLSTDSLLERRDAVGECAPAFVERLYPHDNQVSPVLRRIRTALSANTVSPMWLEEQFHWLLEQMLAVHHRVCADADRLPALRRSVRLDIYQRLCWAREFIEANYQRPLHLAEIAGIACLSPHHFLRLFKQLFRLTPHQYLTHCRLERAQTLLRKTDLTIFEICLDVGFSSPSTFCQLFQRHYAVSTRQFRQREQSR